MRQSKTKPSQAASPSRNTRRIDKVEATRQSLFDAALKVVGENGYAGSSIAKIATRANVAQGTFYSYFDSQQDVFNQLLPFLGNRLLNEIREKLKNCEDPYEREAIGFKAYFEFLSENPEFERILSEASVFTPQGFKDHVENIVSGYMRAFRHSKAKGSLPHYSERELEAITYILLGARAYLSLRFMANGSGRIDSRKLPDWAFTAYMKFMRYGLTGPRRTHAASMKVCPTEAADDGEIDDIHIVSLDRASAAIEVEFDPDLSDLPAMVSRIALRAGSALAGAARTGHAVSHLSCTILGQVSSRERLHALAELEQSNSGQCAISISIRTSADKSILAQASLLMTRPAET